MALPSWRKMALRLMHEAKNEPKAQCTVIEITSILLEEDLKFTWNWKEIDINYSGT